MNDGEGGHLYWREAVRGGERVSSTKEGGWRSSVLKFKKKSKSLCIV